MEVATSPVMFSTLENGKIVRGLAGIPTEGPVLFVGCHMLLGLEVVHFISSLWSERNILVRGIAHPMLFARLRDDKLCDEPEYDGLREQKLPVISAFDGLVDWKLPDISEFDSIRIMGTVPVSPSNFYKLLSSNSHVLLYPGGVHEALHQKGEEYSYSGQNGLSLLGWLPDLEQQSFLWVLLEKMILVKNKIDGEVANQDPHFPVILPELPGRFYYLFGKPIQTKSYSIA